VRGGDFSWPPVGTFRGHQWTLQLANSGDFLMATDSGKELPHQCPEQPGLASPPKRYGTWVTPDNCFEFLADTIRTTIPVRYLDGVSIVEEAIREAAQPDAVVDEASYEARIDGYFAVHLEVPFAARVQNYDISTRVEFQICSQIHEVLRSLTHKIYEQDRSALNLRRDRSRGRLTIRTSCLTTSDT
jgi:hypothetical protein